MRREEESETTPLLPEGREDAGPSSEPSNGSLTPRAEVDASVNGRTNGVAKPSDEEATQDEVDAARASQFEGLPAVRKQLVYILPAVSIGVRTV